MDSNILSLTAYTTDAWWYLTCSVVIRMCMGGKSWWITSEVGLPTTSNANCNYVMLLQLGGIIHVLITRRCRTSLIFGHALLKIVHKLYYNILWCCDHLHQARKEKKKMYHHQRQNQSMQLLYWALGQRDWECMCPACTCKGGGHSDHFRKSTPFSVW